MTDSAPFPLYLVGTHFYCHQAWWGAKRTGMMQSNYSVVLQGHLAYFDFRIDYQPFNMALDWKLPSWKYVIHFSVPFYWFCVLVSSLERIGLDCAFQFSSSSRNGLFFMFSVSHWASLFDLKMCSWVSDCRNHIPLWTQRFQTRGNQNCGSFEGLCTKALSWSQGKTIL